MWWTASMAWLAWYNLPQSLSQANACGGDFKRSLKKHSQTWPKCKTQKLHLSMFTFNKAKGLINASHTSRIWCRKPTGQSMTAAPSTPSNVDYTSPCKKLYSWKIPFLQPSLSGRRLCTKKQAAMHSWKAQECSRNEITNQDLSSQTQRHSNAGANSLRNKMTAAGINMIRMQ